MKVNSVPHLFFTTTYAPLNFPLSIDLELDSEFYQQVKAESGISDEDLFKIENFTYNNYAITSRIFGYLQETNFLGITVSTFSYITCFKWA